MKHFTTLTNLFIRATNAQKLSILLCTILVVSGIIIGLYQLSGDRHPVSRESVDEDVQVNVQAIEDTTSAVDDLMNTPAETIPSTTTSVPNDAPQVVSNTVTVETPPQDYYIAEDGAHYESAPVYEEPAASEPVYEAPAVVSGDSSESFDGNLGNGYKWDTTGGADYGTGISN